MIDFSLLGVVVKLDSLGQLTPQSDYEYLLTMGILSLSLILMIVTSKDEKGVTSK